MSRQIKVGRNLTQTSPSLPLTHSFPAHLLILTWLNNALNRLPLILKHSQNLQKQSVTSTANMWLWSPANTVDTYQLMSLAHKLWLCFAIWWRRSICRIYRHINISEWGATLFISSGGSCYHHFPELLRLSVSLISTFFFWGTPRPVSGSPLLKLHQYSKCLSTFIYAYLPKLACVCACVCSFYHCVQLATRCEVLHALEGFVQMPHSTLWPHCLWFCVELAVPSQRLWMSNMLLPGQGSIERDYETTAHASEKQKTLFHNLFLPRLP